MPEILEKLRPDRDLQCYFERPSAIAALSQASPAGFTLSGCWRQQFDWAVIEWNRDNTFEHPALRNLPDGNLSGLQLSYNEARSNCVPLDSTLYPTIDWPYLRVWAEANGAEQLYKVRLADYATPLEGSLGPASAVFELQGTPTAGDSIELAWLSEHHTYQLYGTDTLESAAQAIVDSINTFSQVMQASRSGRQITLTYLASAGSNGNRVGVYGNVAGAKTESWQPSWQTLSGGTSPTKWRVSLNFGALQDITSTPVPTNSVRKMRWTYAADRQAGSFARCEFSVVVSNWAVSGSNRIYTVAGPGSRRIEDDSTEWSYTGQWTQSRGNFSGGSLRFATQPGAAAQCSYRAAQNHRLYLGTRKAPNCSQISVQVDGGGAQTFDLSLAGEDVLVRLPLGEFTGQVSRTITVTHTGTAGAYFYLDFLEIAVPASELPAFPAEPETTLATDWDTDHSIALAPERTAWLIRTLGFTGRANHYAGALWFYELHRPGHQYAWGTIEFLGTPEFGKTTIIDLGGTPVQHVTLIGDTPASIAKAFALELNAAASGVWAESSGGVLTVHARAMGTQGNAITLSVNTNSSSLTAQLSGAALSGGADGAWRTDVAATPRLNRAVRDWSRSFYTALHGYGIEATAAFSMELQHGDPSAEAGIAQRYPNGDAVWLNTPALQTNFSPASLAFWKPVYREMADILASAGHSPFLQFGEVQWWYFPVPSGMPFYDAHTTSTFAAAYGRPMTVFPDGQAEPSQYPEESAFLPQQIGSFTNAIIDHVRQGHANARFEVLYPPDVNEAPLNQAINLPSADWSPSKLACFKTENFSYTGARDLNKAASSARLPRDLGFSRENSAHLIGIGDYTTPWRKEQRLSRRDAGLAVLFALDQFCLIGYKLPLGRGARRILFMGR